MLKINFNTVVYIGVLPLLFWLVLAPRVNNSMYLELAISLFCIVVNGILSLRKNRIGKPTLVVILLVAWVFVLGLVSSDATTSAKYAIAFLLTLSPIYLSNYIIRDPEDDFDQRRYRVLIPVITVLLAFCFIMSLAYLNINPAAMRQMAADSSFIDFFPAIGGGYKLVFSGILLCALAVFLFKNQNNTKGKVIYFAVYIFLIYFMLRSDVVTAFVLALLLSIPLFFFRKDKVSFRFYIFAFIILLVFILFISDTLYSFAGKIAVIFEEDSFMYKRLMELQYGESSFAGRGERLLRSVETVFNYPIFGVGVHTGFNYYQLESQLGMHSDFFDIPGKYGIPFAIMMYTLFYMQFKKIKEMLKDPAKERLYSILALSIVVTSIFDPVISTNMLLMLYVFIPMILLRKPSLR